jgi:mono/diheme cytochrome c family protein
MQYIFVRIPSWSRLFVLGCIISCGPTVDPAVVAAVIELEGSIEQGRLLFNSECALCHDEDGSGKEIGPDIRQEITKISDTQLVNLVLGGSGQMLPLDFTPQQMADVLAYVRQKFPTP